MQARVTSMVLCGWLIASTTVALYGDETMTTGAKTSNARTFNVLDYGAKGDDQTDNTEAFSACLKAVIEAGGGRMFIPDGIYRGRIIIP